MNKKNKKLEHYRAFLYNRIKAIKNRQNELMLKNILLDSKREELELKYQQVERLIEEQNSVISKQTINTLYNNSYSVLFLN